MSLLGPTKMCGSEFCNNTYIFLLLSLLLIYEVINEQSVRVNITSKIITGKKEAKDLGPTIVLYILVSLYTIQDIHNIMSRNHTKLT